MTKTELLNTAIKIFGLYYFVRFVQHLMEYLFMMIGNNYLGDGVLEGWYIYSGFLFTLGVELTFVFFAIFRTELITRKISKTSEGTLELATNKTDLLEIAFAVISVLAILNSIPNLLAQQVNSIYYHDHKELEFWTTDAKNQLFRNLFILGTGVFLLLNSRNFAKLILKRGERDDGHDQNSER